MGKLFENTYRSRFSLTNDSVFYLVYGAGTEASNRALAALLNVVLDRKDDPIVKVKVLNTVQKGFNLGDKGTVMDVKAEADSGEIIDVEMQRLAQVAYISPSRINMGSQKKTNTRTAADLAQLYRHRSLFYGARLINSALDSGEDYDRIKKSIVISFIDGVIFPELPDLHTEFLVQEKNYHFSLVDKLSLHFVELGKLDDKKDPSELTSLERLCGYIKYAADEKREDYVNKLLDTGEEAVDMSEYVFKELTEDDYAREMLERQIKAEHDQASWLKYAKKWGREEGLEEGLEEGYANAMADMAKKMKKAGKPVEEIMEFTGLDVETIEML